MKGLPFAVMFLSLTVALACAKPAPVSKMNPLEDLNPPLTRNDVDINSGPAGAMERNYFQAPPPFAAGGLPCRLQSAIFNKVQLAQLCR